AANTVFAAVGADQDFAVDGGGSHCFAVAFLRISDLRLPQEASGLGVEGDQLGIQRREINFVVIDGDAAIVRPAAIGRDRTHLVFVMPVLFAGLGVDCINMIE